MYYDKQDLKYISKLNQRVLSRKSQFFKRNLHINGKETDVKIHRCKNAECFKLAIEGYKTLPEKIAFLLIHQTKEKIMTFRNDAEVILTNYRDNKVIELDQVDNCNFNFDVKKMPSYNIWVVKSGTIAFYNIKLNDIIYVR